MAEHEQTADEKETARLDDLAAQNEAVRRAEHPEEFADDAGSGDDADEPASIAPVTPAAGTGANDPPTVAGSGIPLSGSSLPSAEDLSTLERLEAGARELRHRLFGGGGASA